MSFYSNNHTISTWNSVWRQNIFSARFSWILLKQSTQGQQEIFLQTRDQNVTLGLFTCSPCCSHALYSFEYINTHTHTHIHCIQCSILWMVDTPRGSSNTDKSAREESAQTVWTNKVCLIWVLQAVTSCLSEDVWTYFSKGLWEVFNGGVSISAVITAVLHWIHRQDLPSSDKDVALGHTDTGRLPSARGECMHVTPACNPSRTRPD